MIQLTDHGIFLVDGEVRDSAPVSAQEARQQTMAWNILQAHNTSGDPEHLKVRFDAMVSHDITYVGIIQQARASGMKEFPIPYALTNCHNSLCAVGGTINEDDHMFGLSAAKKYGGIYVPANQSVIHSYAREELAALRRHDPRLRLPHALRRARHDGRGRGRPGACQAAAEKHLGRDHARGCAGLSHRRAAPRRRPARRGHRPRQGDVCRAALSTTACWSLPAPASRACPSTSATASTS